MTRSVYNVTLHRLALLTAAATFPLIFIGGLVTSHGAGLSVPDWPNSYGYNMFTFPLSKWVGGIFYEHTHRLMGVVVGLCAIALAVAAWKFEKRRWVRWLALSALVGVIVQGLIGGLRVVWVNLDLAIVHACVAQLFFCLATLVVIVTSRWWIEESPRTRAPRNRAIVAVSIACLVAVYLQLIVGAVMRHEKAGLAIPDLPLAYGKWIPPTTVEGLDAINQQRAFKYQLDPVTMPQIWLHFTHRIGAIVVSILVSALCAMTLLKHREDTAFLLPACALALLLLSQATLGVLTVLLRKPADIASAHVAVGALLLATTLVIVIRSLRVRAIQSIKLDDTVLLGVEAEVESPQLRRGLVAQVIS